MTIIRDSAYGVPHIYGDTRADTMFGAGYAGAADRLFLMDVLRHTGRAELSSFLGGSNAEADAQPVGFAPYTEADCEDQCRPSPRALRRRRARGASPTCRPTSTGSTPTSTAANANPTLMPAEYVLLGKPIEPWKPTDVVAMASLVGGIFGQGGGNELNSALTLRAFASAFGARPGASAWLGLPLQERPRGADDDRASASPTRPRSAFAKRGLALPDRARVRAVDRR